MDGDLAAKARELSRQQRRRVLTLASLRTGATVTALLLVYSLLPAAGESGAVVAIKLIVGLVAFVVLLWFQIAGILRAEHPAVRAVEALVTAVFVVIIVFAFTYLSLSDGNPGAFSQPLGHISAFYFTVTTLGTVGYGDIVARTNAARIIVTIQILIDLVLLVAIGRGLLMAVRVSTQRHATPDAASIPEPPADDPVDPEPLSRQG